MNGKKAVYALCLMAAIFVFWCEPVSADLNSSPTFLLPNDTTSFLTFPSQRTVENGYALTAGYLETNGTWVRQETGAIFTNASGSLSLIENINNYSTLSANPTTFDARAVSQSVTDGDRNYHTWGQAQAWNWYVLEGTPGQQVTLTADILIQGTAFANNGSGGNAASLFVNSLGFLSSPTDLVQDYVIALAGTVGWNEPGFGSTNTVDEDVFWAIGNTTHEVNYIIRSQPFTVTVGVPFRLSLLSKTETFAGPGGWGEARADFFDPRLVTSQDFQGIPYLTPDGFAVVIDGNYSTLGAQGYSITRVPEPAAILLIGLGLIVLAGFRKKLLN